MKKRYSIIVWLFVFFTFFIGSWNGVSTGDTSFPEWRNQGQNKIIIRPGESIFLYAQGRDTTALNYAWLATNETGSWMNVTGLPGWKYCKQIIIHHEFVGANLTDFPVLVMCTSSDFTAYAQPDGDDFVFTDSTATIRYAHEIEYYNSATGELAAWVKIPFLSSMQDTVFYMYYGNADCGSQQNVAGTWDSNFILVDHLTGATSADLKDSSPNHWDITSAGGNPNFNQPGKAGRCVDFDGVDDYLQTNLFRLPTDSSYTGSAWVYVDGNAGKQRFIFDGVSDNCAISLSVWTNETFKNYAKTNSGGATAASYSATKVDVAHPQWYYVCTQVNATNNTLKLFVNGIMERNAPITGLVNPEPTGLNIGKSQFPSDPWMNGKIDEVRISNIPLSDNWIKTEYNMIASPSTFMTVNDGSPLQMQKNNQWQWSNFTWENPSISIGTQVGWRIYYNDTSGNVNYTPAMSFTIVKDHNPPDTPERSTGSTSGYTGVDYSYSVNPVTDPEGDQVSYLFSWDDGSTSNWLDTPHATHAWNAIGTYEVKVKTKDNYGEESSWSPSLSVMIITSLPELVINAPSAVQEGSSFPVTVTAGGIPAVHTQVEFFGKTYYVDMYGQVNLSAPSVEQTTDYPLIASKVGYQSATMLITVLNYEEALPKGYIYGWISNISGQSIEGANVCALLADGGTTLTCASTNSQGRYMLLVPIGNYTVEVSKQGYITSIKYSILVKENNATGVSFELKTIEQEISVSKKDIIDYAIQYGIKEGIVGGEITIPENQPGVTTVYDERLSLNLTTPTGEGEFQFTVAGPHGSKGTVIALRIDNPADVLNTTVNDLRDIVVEYDNVRIEMANNSGDIFGSLTNATHPTWAGLLTGKLYILIRIPEFSEHTITITTIITKTVDQTLIILSYIAFCIAITVAVVIPILRIERKK